jgi:hypothetical protein
MANHATKGRSIRTRGVNDQKLKSDERLGHKNTDPQGLLTVEVVRRHIETCTCPLCGAGPFKVLPMHTNQAHGIDKKQLRQMAGLTSTQPISSAEFREKARLRASSLGLPISHFEDMGKRRSSLTGVELTDAGRKRISETVKSTNSRPDVIAERSGRMKQWALDNPAGSLARKRQGDSLRKSMNQSN